MKVIYEAEVYACYDCPYIQPTESGTYLYCTHKDYPKDSNKISRVIENCDIIDDECPVAPRVREPQ